MTDRIRILALIYVIANILFASCSHYSENNDYLFSSRSLQDSLQDLITHIDTIPDPSSAPLTFIVSFYKFDSLSTVMLLASPGLASVPPDAEYIGMTFMHNRPVGIYCNDTCFYKQFDIAKLDRNVNPKYEFTTFFKGESWDGCYPPSRREYVISDDGSLDLIKSSRSRYEVYCRQYRDLPRILMKRCINKRDARRAICEIIEYDVYYDDLYYDIEKLLERISKEFPSFFHKTLSTLTEEDKRKIMQYMKDQRTKIQ